MKPKTMNPADATGKAAVLHYGDGEFVVLSAGSHVHCAQTRKTIPLTALRYWSVAYQEAYLGPIQYMQAQSIPAGKNSQ